MINKRINFGVRGHDMDAIDLPQLAQKLNDYSIGEVQLVLKKSCKGFEEGMFSPTFANKIGDLFYKNNVNISIFTFKYEGFMFGGRKTRCYHCG